MGNLLILDTGAIYASVQPEDTSSGAPETFLVRSAPFVIPMERYNVNGFTMPDTGLHNSFGW